MGGSRRAACVAVAWLVPFVWLAVQPLLDPTDGTVVTSPTAVLTEGRWGASLLVLETYGDTQLRVGDEILAIDDRPVDELLTARDATARDAGEIAVYRVRRPEVDLDRIQLVEVQLTRYPVTAALADNLHFVVVVAGLLVAGSVLLLRAAGADRHSRRSP